MKATVQAVSVDIEPVLVDVATQTEIISKPRTRQRRLRRQQIAAQQRA